MKKVRKVKKKAVTIIKKIDFDTELIDGLIDIEKDDPIYPLYFEMAKKDARLRVKDTFDIGCPHCLKTLRHIKPSIYDLKVVIVEKENKIREIVNMINKLESDLLVRNEKDGIRTSRSDTLVNLGIEAVDKLIIKKVKDGIRIIFND